MLAAREARALSLRRPQLLPRPSAGKGLPVAARARAAMLFFLAHAWGVPGFSTDRSARASKIICTKIGEGAFLGLF